MATSPFTPNKPKLYSSKDDLYSPYVEKTKKKEEEPKEKLYTPIDPTKKTISEIAKDIAESKSKQTPAPQVKVGGGGSRGGSSSKRVTTTSDQQTPRTERIETTVRDATLEETKRELQAKGAEIVKSRGDEYAIYRDPSSGNIAAQVRITRNEEVIPQFQVRETKYIPIEPTKTKTIFEIAQDIERQKKQTPASFARIDPITEELISPAELEQRTKARQLVALAQKGKLKPEDVIPKGSYLPLTPENIAATKELFEINLAAQDRKTVLGIATPEESLRLRLPIIDEFGIKKQETFGNIAAIQTQIKTKFNDIYNPLIEETTKQTYIGEGKYITTPEFKPKSGRLDVIFVAATKTALATYSPVQKETFQENKIVKPIITTALFTKDLAYAGGDIVFGKIPFVRGIYSRAVETVDPFLTSYIVDPVKTYGQQRLFFLFGKRAYRALDIADVSGSVYEGAVKGFSESGISGAISGAAGGFVGEKISDKVATPVNTFTDTAKLPKIAESLTRANTQGETYSINLRTPKDSLLLTETGTNTFLVTIPEPLTKKTFTSVVVVPDADLGLKEYEIKRTVVFSKSPKKNEEIDDILYPVTPRTQEKLQSLIKISPPRQAVAKRDVPLGLGTNVFANLQRNIFTDKRAQLTLSRPETNFQGTMIEQEFPVTNPLLSITPTTLQTGRLSPLTARVSITQPTISNKLFTVSSPVLKTQTNALAGLSLLNITKSLTESTSRTETAFQSLTSSVTMFDTVSPSVALSLSVSPSITQTLTETPTQTITTTQTLTRTPTITLTQTLTPKKEKRMKVESFNVYVKEKGRDIKVNKQPQTKDAALSLMAEFVDNTASATGRIKATSGKAGERESNYLFLDNKFKQKKQQVYIEKNAFRIDSRGELEQITVKGWQARRSMRSSILK